MTSLPGVCNQGFRAIVEWEQTPGLSVLTINKLSKQAPSCLNPTPEGFSKLLPVNYSYTLAQPIDQGLETMVWNLKKNAIFSGTWISVINSITKHMGWTGLTWVVANISVGGQPCDVKAVQHSGVPLFAILAVMKNVEHGLCWDVIYCHSALYLKWQKTTM